MPLALYLLALAVFAMGTSEFMLAGLLLDLADDLRIPVGVAGLTTSAYAAGMVVGAPALAVVARRWPPRATLLSCLGIFASCHLAGAVTNSFEVLLATRVIAAAANAGFLAVALTAATRLVGGGGTGRAVAILLGGTTLAMVVGAPAGAVLGVLVDWRATFVAVALLCLPAAAGVMTSGRVERSADEPIPLRAEVRRLGSPVLLVAMLLAAAVNAGTFAVLTFLGPLVKGVVGLSEEWVPMALALVGFGAFAGITVAGRFTDRQPVAVVVVAGPTLVLAWGALAFGAGTPLAMALGAFAAGALAFGLGSALIAGVLVAGLGAPSLRGAFATAALNVGALVGPALGGWVLSGPLAERGVLVLAAALTAAAVPPAALLAGRRGPMSPD